MISDHTQVGEGEDEVVEPNLGYLKRSPVSAGLGEPGWTSQGLLMTMMSSGLCWGEASRGRESPSPRSCHWMCSLLLTTVQADCGASWSRWIVFLPHSSSQAEPSRKHSPASR